MDSGAFTVAVEGAVLAGETRGDGAPALALIHGMGGSRRDWGRLVAALPPGLPLLRHDLRGFGQSTAEPGVPFSHADDLLALLDACGIERIALVGLSMGGGIALHFALDHPERVSRLVLISPALIGWDWSDEWKALWRACSAPARAGNLAAARAAWLAHPMFTQLLQTDAADEFRAEIAGWDCRQFIASDERAELPDVERLHILAMPALLLTGERDFADLRLIADMIAASAPNVHRIDYPGAGHMLHLERTAEVAAAIAGSLTH